MKKVLLICVSVLLTLTACQKDVHQFVGDYSYKISGSMTVDGLLGVYDKMLTPRIGQMNILPVNGSDKQRVMITMNDSGGRAYVCYGTVSGNTLIIDTYTFSTELFLEAGENGVYNMQASGSGELTDDVLVINETWHGVKTDNRGVTVQGDDILIVAKRNS